MNNYDKKALNILKSYHPVYPDKTSCEDYEHAKKNGLMFEKKKMTHDEILSWAFEMFNRCSKKSITDSFIYGLSYNAPYYRASLSAYAVMTNYPRHDYKPYTSEINNPHCNICALYEEQYVDLSFINACRWCGAIIGREPDILAFYLHQHQKEESVIPDDKDIKKFIILLNTILESAPEETPTTLLKRLRKLNVLKMKHEEIKYLLDTLGYCGILESPEHKGFIYQFTSYLNPKKSRSSDWGYPVDFWTGRVGVNFDALNYWFGSYFDMKIIRKNHASNL